MFTHSWKTKKVLTFKKISENIDLKVLPFLKTFAYACAVPNIVDYKAAYHCDINAELGPVA